MFLTKLLFTILIIICSAFYILYIWDFALILLIVMISLPAMMFITTFITKFMIRSEFVLRDKTVQKNTEFPVQLCISNRSIFPVGKAEAHVEYYNVFNNQITSFELLLPIQPRNSQRITFQLSSKYCGMLIVRTAYINIYDPLRIFRFRISKNVSTEIAVLPASHDIGGTVSEADRSDEESIVFSDNKPGDDPSEVFGLREYVAGDKLNRIHWKLSSKKDELVVKDYSLPVDVPSMIFLDLKCYEDSEYTLPVFDTLIETFLSLSQLLAENERLHRVVFYNGKGHCFTEKEVTNHRDLADTVRLLINSFNDNLYCESPQKYFSSTPQLSLSSFTYISSFADKKMISYISSDIDADIKNAVIIVKSAQEMTSIDSDDSQIYTLPVVIGRISSSIKDIEL